MTSLRLRAFVAASTAIALASTSANVRAQEIASAGPEPVSVVSTVLPPELAPITPRLDLFAATHPAPFSFAPAPSDIRLSRGAKTAIIVTAIVVGALLVVGVVVIAAKPKHIGP